jgi:UDP-N-acetylmuramate--alanine ligase
MSFPEIPSADPDLRQLIKQAYEKITSYSDEADARWWLVDVIAQRLIRIQGQTPVAAWPVSTAAVGLDNRQDSGGTPPGVHRVDQKLGADCPPGTIFVSREDTGERWPLDRESSDDLILTRIVTLSGCEPGLNQGPGVDSRERYIYLHGTNHEDRIGAPVSGGCVRLTNADICVVFDQIQEGDPLVIV